MGIKSLVAGICREKYGGVYIYFSDTGKVREKQIWHRSSTLQRTAIVTISDHEAIMILVAIIRQQNISVENILALPEIKRLKLKPFNVQGFMGYHGLLKKILDSEH